MSAIPYTLLFFIFIILFTSVSFSVAKQEDILIVTSTAPQETYFQLSGFPSSSIVHRPRSVSDSALYGYSLTSFRDANGSYFLVGAPRSGRTGQVQQCRYNDRGNGRPNFECQSLPFTGINPPDVEVSDENMFLGGSVSSLSYNNEAFLLYCGHLYKTRQNASLHAMGLCNLQKSGRQEQPLVINPCGIKVKYSCLAGFSSALTISPNDHRLLLAIGMPANEMGLANVKLAAVQKSLSSSNLEYKVSHKNQFLSTYYSGYSISFGQTTTENGLKLFVSTPLDYKQPRAPRIEYFKNLNQRMLKLKGKVSHAVDHMGGFFGFSLSSFSPKPSTDGLIVGEPFFSELSENLIDVGRIYVYCRLSERPRVLRGEKANSLFGFSIARLGDINGDNVPDFAVGCPYCDQGYGNVYIFLGDPECKIDQPVDVIRGRDVSSLLGSVPMKGFGFSISGGEDLDGNKSPDLIIGTPLKNRVVVARARSSITMTCSLVNDCKLRSSMIDEGTCSDFHRNRQRGCRCPEDIIITFDLEFSDPKVLYNGLKFNISIDLDFKKNISKRVMEKPFGKSTYSVIKMLKDNENGLSVNFRPIVNTIRYRQDMVTPIEFEARLALVDQNQVMKDSQGRMFPSPRFTKHDKCGGKVRILYKQCGNKPCKTDMLVYIILEKADSAGTNVIHYNRMRLSNRFTRLASYPTKKQTIRIIVGSDQGTIAMKPTLIMYFRHGLKYIRTELDEELREDEEIMKDGKLPICNVLDDETRVVCDFKNAFFISLVPVIIVHVNLDGLYRTIEENGGHLPPGSQFEAETKTVSEDLRQFNDRVAMNFSINYQPTIQLASGKSIQTSVDDRNTSVYINPKSRVLLNQIGPALRHVYQLSNTGPSPARNISVNITMPVASENGDHIIYLLKEVRTIGEGSSEMVKMEPRVVSESGRSSGRCIVPEAFLNPRQLTVIQTRKGLRELRNAWETQSTNGTFFHRRYRRSVEVGSTSDTKGGKRHPNQRPKEQIMCGKDSLYHGRPRCIEIQCYIDQLEVNDVVRIVIDGRLWARTTVERTLTDIEVSTRARGIINWVPTSASKSEDLEFGPFEITTHFLFLNVKLPVIQRLPIWPIILGIIVGLIFLGLIIILLYKCGFFKRRRPSRPPPPSYAVISMPKPPLQPHHTQNLNGMPLLSKHHSTGIANESVDDFVDREFEDMERSIRSSAMDIQMRRKTEEDREVDRLVRQVSTHRSVVSERPISFPNEIDDFCLGPSEKLGKSGSSTLPVENRNSSSTYGTKNYTYDDQSE